jgi:hypothetical protein
MLEHVPFSALLRGEKGWDEVGSRNHSVRGRESPTSPGLSAPAGEARLFSVTHKSARLRARGGEEQITVRPQRRCVHLLARKRGRGLKKLSLASVSGATNSCLPFAAGFLTQPVNGSYSAGPIRATAPQNAAPLRLP